MLAGVSVAFLASIFCIARVKLGIEVIYELYARQEDDMFWSASKQRQVAILALVSLATTAWAESEDFLPKPAAPLGELVTADDYPIEAMRLGQEGIVRFRLRVDETGKPDGCVILASSGWPILDDKTCDVLLSRAKFIPAKDARDNATRGDYRASLIWKMPVDLVMDRTSDFFTVTWLDSAEGEIHSCERLGNAAEILGGCEFLSKTATLEKLLQRPLSSVKRIQFRMGFVLADVAPEKVSDGADLKPIAHIGFDIAANGTIENCVAASIAIADKSIDVCAELKKAGLRWKPDPAGRSQKASFNFDVLSWPRQPIPKSPGPKA